MVNRLLNLNRINPALRLLIAVLSTIMSLSTVSLAEGAGGKAVEVNAEVRALMDSYLEEAKVQNPGIRSFNADEGKRLFFSERVHTKKGENRGCTSCHTKDLGKAGRTKAGKRIEPLSPSVTKDRFTESKKIEKWFKRNCKWTLERQCTAEEKGNLMTFFLSL